MIRQAGIGKRQGIATGPQDARAAGEFSFSTPGDTVAFRRWSFGQDYVTEETKPWQRRDISGYLRRDLVLREQRLPRPAALTRTGYSRESRSRRAKGTQHHLRERKPRPSGRDLLKPQEQVWQL